MTKNEIRMKIETTNPNVESAEFGVKRRIHNAFVVSSLPFRHSFDIRVSFFVIIKRATHLRALVTEALLGCVN
jgi:hypothetical protein